MTVVGWCAVDLGLVGLIVVVCIPHNLRVRRVRRGYRRLGKDVIEKVLALVREVVSSSLAENLPMNSVTRFRHFTVVPVPIEPEHPRTPSASAPAARGLRADGPYRPRSTPTLAARCF